MKEHEWRGAQKIETNLLYLDPSGVALASLAPVLTSALLYGAACAVSETIPFIWYAIPLAVVSSFLFTYVGIAIMNAVLPRIGGIRILLARSDSS